jgi:hypothetical protein
MDVRVPRETSRTYSLLEQAWGQYLDTVEHRLKHKLYADDESTALFDIAVGMIAPIAPSLAAIEHHLLSILPRIDEYQSRCGVEIFPSDLGNFGSAAYQCLPQQEIICDLDMPDLGGLGSHLNGKLLRITGTLGDFIGDKMVGTLIIEGHVGSYAGNQMIGTFVGNDRCKNPSAGGMIGCSSFKEGHKGTLLGRKNDCWFGIPPGRRQAFLEDIANPEHLSHHDLYRRLMDAYSPRQTPWWYT